MGVVADDFVKTIFLCVHCGDECAKGKYCKNCATAADRKACDEENARIRKEQEVRNDAHAMTQHAD